MSTEAQKQYQRWYRENHPAKVKAGQKRWRLKNPDKVKSYYGTWTKKNPTARKKSLLKRRYGITPATYDVLLLAQNHKCAICQLPETIADKYGNIRALAVDHCHRTKTIRGLLCQSCNTGIGQFKDSLDLLQKAMIYLSQVKKEIV